MASFRVLYLFKNGFVGYPFRWLQTYTQTEMNRNGAVESWAAVPLWSQSPRELALAFVCQFVGPFPTFLLAELLHWATASQKCKWAALELDSRIWILSFGRWPTANEPKQQKIVCEACPTLNEPRAEQARAAFIIFYLLSANVVCSHWNWNKYIYTHAST